MKIVLALVIAFCIVAGFMIIVICSPIPSPISLWDALVDPIEWRPHWTGATNGIVQFKGINSIATTPNGDIWVIADLYDNQQVIHYSPDFDKVSTYIVETYKGRGIPSRLFVTQDGTLWGVGFWYKGQRLDHDEPVLCRYDAVEDRFVRIVDMDGLLLTSVVRDIAEDHSGNFWIIQDETRAKAKDLGQSTSRFALFRYDPVMNKAVKVNLQGSLEGVGAVAVAPDGTLWVVGLLSTAIPGKRYNTILLQYDPVTDKVEIHVPPRGKNLGLLYFDHTSRLWTNTIGWLDLPLSGNPVWSDWLKPNVFLKEVILENSHIWWMAPNEIYETSNGQMWFPSEAGLVVYNRAQDKWRRVNDWITPVIEDRHHRLWTAINSQFYSYQLKR
jgi:hypothetical protein